MNKLVNKSSLVRNPPKANKIKKTVRFADVIATEFGGSSNIIEPSTAPAQTAAASTSASTLSELIQHINSDAHAVQLESTPATQEPDQATTIEPVVEDKDVTKETAEAIKQLQFLTETYLEHLTHLNTSKFTTEQKELFTLKLNQVKKLHEVISAPAHNFMINQFNAILENAHNALLDHRDPKWQRYVKNCLIVLGILITGIIPYFVYTIATNRSPLFFTKTEGEKYYDDAHDLAQEYITQYESPAVDV